MAQESTNGLVARLQALSSDEQAALRQQAKAHLTAATHQWGDYYTKSVQDAVAGTWKTSQVWGGYKEGMIRLAPLNAAIPADVKSRLMNALEKRMAARRAE